jgi:[ribosomal protein S18]-alanine N-acetyltransferase
MTDWRILPITAEALDDVVAVHRLCFPDESWDRNDFAGILAMAGASGHWAVDAADAWRRRQAFLFDTLLSPIGEIITLGVTPAIRRQGAARALMEDLIVRARGLGVRALTLEVADDNAAALGLYAGLGFTRVGRRLGYYKRPDGSTMDAGLLRRNLVD